MEVQEEKRKFSKKLDEMLSTMEREENPYPEMEAFNKWMDGLCADLGHVLADSVSKMPTREGAPEAVLTGLGRFVCMYLERLQRGGWVTHGVDIFEMFKEVLLPECHRLVVRELDDEEKYQAMVALFKAIKDGYKEDELTPEEVFDKYIKDGNKERYVKIITELLS